MAEEGLRRTMTLRLDPEDEDIVESEEVIQVINKPNLIQYSDGIIVAVCFWLIALISVVSMGIYAWTLKNSGDQALIVAMKWAIGFSVLWAVLFILVIALFGQTIVNLLQLNFTMLNSMVSTIIVNYAILGYLQGTIPAESLYLYCLPFFAFDVVIKIFSALFGRVTHGFFEVCLRIQLLVIALNLGYWHLKDWWLLLGYFQIFYICLFYLGVIFVVIGVIFLVVLAFKWREAPATFLLGTGFVFPMYFFLTWGFIAAYYYFESVKRMFYSGAMDAKNHGSPVDPGIASVSETVFVLSILTLVFSVFGLICFFFFLRHLGGDQNSKVFTLQKYINKMNLNYHLTSDTYFQPNEEKKSEEEESLVSNEKKMENCYICTENPTDVMLKPCGHTGICKACILEWLKKNQSCPSCKTEIEKFYLIEYDEERRRYQAKGRVVLKVQ